MASEVGKIEDSLSEIFRVCPYVNHGLHRFRFTWVSTPTV